jgi:hypothetical protein
MSNRFRRAMATRDAVRRQRAARVPHLFTCARCGRQVEQVHDGVCDDCQPQPKETPENNANKKT